MPRVLIIRDPACRFSKDAFLQEFEAEYPGDVAMVEPDAIDPELLQNTTEHVPGIKLSLWVLAARQSGPYQDYAVFVAASSGLFDETANQGDFVFASIEGPDKDFLFLLSPKGSFYWNSDEHIYPITDDRPLRFIAQTIADNDEGYERPKPH